ncbi:type II secretion system protein [Candidatus Saccharibacteria bacterium]|nr:type II secretion system protein [Candidatus Saccharibacteria bacterium]
MGKKGKVGFTLIELSLSLVFVAILSIMMVLIISNTVSSYRRGITLNKVNTLGMDLVDDMRTAVQNSTAGSLTAECTKRFPDDGKHNNELATARSECKSDGGKSFVKMTKKASVKLADGTTLNSVPVYGVFCTGSYSYIWNSGYFDEKTGATVINASPAEFKYGDQLEVKGFRLLKIQDDSRAVCRSRAVAKNENTGALKYKKTNLADNNVFDISNGFTPLAEEPVDLILEDLDNDLAIYDLSVADPAESSTQENVFYSVSFILGTLEGGVNITTAGRSCAVPEDDANEFFDYCAINNFTFAVQANGQ